MKHPTGGGLIAGAILFVAALSSQGAGATTIDFNGLSGANGTPFGSYTESGFSVIPTTSAWDVATSGNGLQAFGNPGPSIIFHASGIQTQSVQITDGGVPFDFRSIDIYSSITPIPYTFTGLLNGTQVFSVSGTQPNTLGTFATVYNPNGAAAIDTLQVSITNTVSVGNSLGLDNIVTTAAGSVFGDPHFVTFSGQRYDFQSVGTFTLVQSTVAGHVFDVQVRTASLGDGSGATVVTATSARLGADVVTFDLALAKLGKTPLTIDGQAVSLDATTTTRALGAGKIVWLGASHYQVLWNSGEILDVTLADGCINLATSLAPDDGPGSVTGLLVDDDPLDATIVTADTSLFQPGLEIATDIGSINSAGNVPAGTTAAVAETSTEIPEPSSIAALVLALAGLAVARRRKVNGP